MATKVDVFSGFLGAGKTTLIKKLIADGYNGQKLVLIENEFGQIGIDGGFLKEAGIEITEMNSGCICCSLVGDFGTALKEVIDKYAPDRILIEPSGVGKLSDVVAAVEKVEGTEVCGTVTVIDASKCSVKRRKPIGDKRNEFTDACIWLIKQAYEDFRDIRRRDTTNGLEVEVKIKDNEDFKYSKVVVERPITDDSGQPILKKGKPQADSSKRDTESIPWKEDITAYMKKNVLPYAPDAWIDDKKTKIGYEIPFTREFYKYVAPRKSDEIYASLLDLDRQEQELMAKIIGK